ncbi:MAG: hypothetical protein BZY79_05310 [SAR202 cluster bacterium Casp-Chloro-G4]|nr:efflux RND transporter periplasmic adaptor subunit [Chloroflexota bacterium]MDA1227296.1 efflux RND transporter periplasmic adaptor subunit [Chloroflexota bacterium]PKB61167.1 MAG: hypothetical protein BZY79_05310 [SAR202 cluster bacterium Casp-Chloro-G4]
MRLTSGDEIRALSNWLADALRDLSRRQIAILATVVVASFVVTYGIYSMATSAGGQSLEENQRLFPISVGDLTNEVAVNGSITFAKKEVLTFGSQGTVAEVLVAEGQEVEEGQPLVLLDAETTSQLQVSYAQANLDYLQAKADLDTARASNLPLAQAELDLQAALDVFEALVGPDPQALADAESAAADAAIALRDAQEAFDDVAGPSAAFVAEAQAALAEAQIAYRDAKDALGGDSLTASDSLTAAVKDLSVARQELKIAQATISVDDAQASLDQAEEDYAGAIKKWTGVTLTDEELLHTSDELFETWDFDPNVIYKSGYDLFPDGVFGDAPNTKWNELTVYAWVALHPSSAAIEITCDVESEEVTVTTAGRSTLSAAQQFCIERDTEDTWQALQDERLAFDTQVAQAEKNLTQAEATVISAEKAFDGLDGGPESDLLQHQLIIAARAMADAEQDLENVLGPNTLELARVSALLAAAQAAYDNAVKALDAVINPDPMEVAIAQSNSDAAKRAAENANGLYQMKLALEEARVASAKALLDGARRRFENSTLTAPWPGFVSTVHVEAGQDVQGTAEIVEVINPSIVVVEGIVDEIDVLSLQRGAQATVSMDALPGQTLIGTVSTISSAASNQQGVVTFDVEIVVNVPADLRLQEGLSAVANVALGRERGLLVPNQAIHGSFSQPQVLVSNGGSLEERVVVLGSSDGFWTIVQQGLSEGELYMIEIQDANAQQLGFRGFGGGGGGNPGGGGGGNTGGR